MSPYDDLCLRVRATPTPPKAKTAAPRGPGGCSADWETPPGLADGEDSLSKAGQKRLCRAAGVCRGRGPAHLVAFCSFHAVPFSCHRAGVARGCSWEGDSLGPVGSFGVTVGVGLPRTPGCLGQESSPLASPRRFANRGVRVGKVLFPLPLILDIPTA